MKNYKVLRHTIDAMWVQANSEEEAKHKAHIEPQWEPEEFPGEDEYVIDSEYEDEDEGASGEYDYAQAEDARRMIERDIARYEEKD